MKSYRCEAVFKTYGIIKIKAKNKKEALKIFNDFNFNGFESRMLHNKEDKSEVFLELMVEINEKN
jgi:hypothetical protein